MKYLKLWTIPLLIVAMFLVTACGQAAEPAVQEEEPEVAAPAEEAPEEPVAEEPAAEDEMMESTIVDVAVADGRFATLVTALEAAGLAETLQGEGPFTVFAPTDEAFATLPEGTLETLLADPAALSDVLLYHVVPGQVMAADVVGLETAETVQGANLNITVEGDQVMINDAQVVITDIESVNGVIHVVDSVLLPPSEEEATTEEAMGDEMMETTIVDVAVADGRFATLITALEAAELVETLQGEGPFTVFAPTDEAFAALPEGTLDTLLADPAALSDVLLYHVVPGQVMAADVVGLETAETAQGAELTVGAEGEQVTINDAQIILTDIEASNGVIHVIDTVLIP